MNEKVLEEARKIVAGFLKNRRQELGITQKELAEKCGMKQESIARMEAAKFFLNTKQLFILCNALDLYVFMEEKESEKPLTEAMKYRFTKEPPSKN